MILEGTGLLYLLHLFSSEPVTKAIMKTLIQKTFTAKHNVFVLLIKMLYGSPPFLHLW